MVLVLWCTGTTCQRKFVITVALVRQFNAIKSKNSLRALGVTNSKI